MTFREFCVFVALLLFAAAVLLSEGWLFRANPTHAFTCVAGGLGWLTLALAPRHIP